MFARLADAFAASSRPVPVGPCRFGTRLPELASGSDRPRHVFLSFEYEGVTESKRLRASSAIRVSISASRLKLQDVHVADHCAMNRAMPQSTRTTLGSDRSRDPSAGEMSLSHGPASCLDAKTSFSVASTTSKRRVATGAYPARHPWNSPTIVQNS